MDSPTTVFTSASTQTSLSACYSPPKRKRRPAGTPDPNAEVIALSPKTLMESDRYVCEICNQGFQRDQNLQMHRRRHKVPWKLVKRVDPEVRKRVYVCPEPSCLHNHPCHALGDLVGIKKHYRRKHSAVKQWECEKCAKAYAVQSDYKAHLKTCGTRGHCCNCGRVFSRIESFIEHQDTCTAARNKKGSASTDQLKAAASLPSLAVPTTEKAMKDNHLHHSAIMTSPQLVLPHGSGHDRSNIPLHPLPFQMSTCPASAPICSSATNGHACIPIPATDPPPLISPTSLVNASAWSRRSPHSMVMSTSSQATQDGNVSWETQQLCIAHNHLSLQDQKAELQLLPTMETRLNQLESSQSSVTWGRDPTSINSTTSGTCSSPASKTVDGKCMCKGADCPEMLPTESGAAPAATIAPCKLQLSIGLSSNDDLTYCGKSTSLHVSRGNIANQENKSEQLAKPCLAWSAFLLHGKVDACHNVPNIGATKKHSSLHGSSDANPGITASSMDAYEGAIDLQLAAGYAYHCGSVELNQTTALDKVNQLQQSQDLCSEKANAETATELSDQNSIKPSHNLQDEEVIEVLQVMQRSCKWSWDSNGAESSKLLRCSSALESTVAVDELDQLQTEQSNSLLGSVKGPDSASELWQSAGTDPNSYVSQKPEMSLGPNINAPAETEAAEELLQKAREELRRAVEEKLAAEKAWREARREREQAEKELGKAQRISEYNRLIAMGKGALNISVQQQEEEIGGTRKASCSSSTSSSNSQTSFSSLLQMRQVHAGGLLCNAPSFVTCPCCHHTQILYPSPSNMGALLLASPLELAPATTLIGTPHSNIQVPSSPIHQL